MNILLPPTRASLASNLRLLRDDWRLSGWTARYFMASQMLSLGLMALCAAGSIVAIVAEDLGAYLGLLAASAICFVHTVTTWSVLKRRFFVRYQLL
jgi:hypothetical protein